MTKLDRLLNALFSRMKGQEGGTNAGFVFYWFCDGTHVKIIKQQGSQSLFKPKQGIPPKTGVLVAACLCPDTKGLILDFKLCKPDGTAEAQASLLYMLEDIQLAAKHAVAYLTYGAVPQVEEEIQEEL